jgi:predicted O-methyltransferase YrrM
MDFRVAISRQIGFLLSRRHGGGRRGGRTPSPSLVIAGEQGYSATAAIAAVENEAPEPTVPEPPIWPPGHFYSPIADPALVRANFDRIFDRSKPVTGIPINFEEFRAKFREFPEAVDLMNIPETPTVGRRYFFQNPAFSYGDAATYCWMFASNRPRRVIEVGSGYSSCLLMDMRDAFDLQATEVTLIEPHLQLFRELVGDEKLSRVNLIESPVQEVEDRVFSSLEKNDILFIDSTHVTKIDSDVNHHLFRILPALKSGVLIHFHDIFFPFEYPPEWILEENRSWNELYILRAYLTNNPEYEIVFFNSAFAHVATEEDRKVCPTFFKNTGGSLWLRKR